MFDWKQRISAKAKNRPSNKLKELCAPFLGRSDMVLLGGGLPNPSAFPISKISVQLIGGETVEVSEKDDVNFALQYNGAGVKSLQTWCRSFIQKHVKPINKDWDVMLTAGSSDALEKCFNLLLNPGDIVFTEDHTYSASLSNLRAAGGRAYAIEADGEGMLPSKLEEACIELKNLEEKENVGARKNKLTPTKAVGIYIIPVGANPTGHTMSNSRMKKLYEIAKKYDLWILEDCAYEWLQYNDDTKSSEVPGLRFGGFQSLDIDGRAIRIDTVSKFLAPGLRTGWLTAPRTFLAEFLKVSALSTQTGSAVSQSIVLAMLRKWGPEGLDKHIRSVQKQYQIRRNIVADSFDKELKGLCQWRVPNAGMFFWFRPLPNLTKGKAFDSQKSIPLLIRNKVLIVPGELFRASEDGDPSPWFRLSFSFASHEDLREGVKKVARMLREL